MNSVKRTMIAIASAVAAVALPATSAVGYPISGLVPVRGAPALRVDGNEIVDANGAPLQLDGVNRSGAEYMCVGGWSVFDGPANATSLGAIVAWHVHVIRIPLNEDCWLGINGIDPRFGGARYRSAVEGFVSRIEAAGMDVILDLHWNAPGHGLARGQLEMPDASHAPAFWHSVATAFGADPAVVFDLYNEPHDVSWRCWRDGCVVHDGGTWRAVGMQRLVDVVRGTGATNVIMLGGLGWSGDLTSWRRFMPNDPLGQLAASWHVYSFGSCTDPTCWDANVAAMRGVAPIVVGEFGQVDCRHDFVDRFMAWADRQDGGVGLGYVAWTWDDLSSCDGPTLITSYDGTPTAYGVGVRDHFVDRFAAQTT
jgi:endoglucanase